MSRLSSPNPDLPDALELEALSAYLDNALPAVDRAVLEQRLSAEPALRAELEALRHTSALLKNAPVVVPPRNFTLDPAQYRRATPRPPRAIWLPMGVIGAAAAVLLVTLIAVQGTAMLQTSRAIPVPSGPRPIAVLPTLPPTLVFTVADSPTPLSAAASKVGSTAGSAAQIATNTIALQATGAADSVGQVTMAANALISPSLPPPTAVAAIVTQFPAPVSPGINNGAVTTQNGASDGSGGASPPNGNVPGIAAPSPATMTSTTSVALAAQPTLSSSPTMPPVTGNLLTFWTVIFWLLTLLGVKGLS